MKNIHVIPTDKPNEVYLPESCLLKQLTAQFIYIVSEEKIRDCYVLNTYSGEVYFCKKDYGFQPRTKKIIFTNDLKLITDGIPKIPDNIIESLLQNENCDNVDVKQIIKDYIGEYDAYLPKTCFNKQLESYQNVMLTFPDIRNKLSPITNLIAMLESSRIMYHDNPEVHKLMEEEIKQCKISIKYLCNEK